MEYRFDLHFKDKKQINENIKLSVSPHIGETIKLCDFKRSPNDDPHNFKFKIIDIQHITYIEKKSKYLRSVYVDFVVVTANEV